MEEAQPFELVFQGPVDDSPETLRRIKGVLIADFELSVQEVQEILSSFPTTVKRSDDEGEIAGYSKLLKRAGGSVLIIKPRSNSPESTATATTQPAQDSGDGALLSFSLDELLSGGMSAPKETKVFELTVDDSAEPEIVQATPKDSPVSATAPDAQLFPNLTLAPPDAAEEETAAADEAPHEGRSEADPMELPLFDLDSVGQSLERAPKPEKSPAPPEPTKPDASEDGVAEGIEAILESTAKHQSFSSAPNDSPFELQPPTGDGETLLSGAIQAPDGEMELDLKIIPEEGVAIPPKKTEAAPTQRPPAPVTAPVATGLMFETESPTPPAPPPPPVVAAKPQPPPPPPPQIERPAPIYQPDASVATETAPEPPAGRPGIGARAETHSPSRTAGARRRSKLPLDIIVPLFVLLPILALGNAFYFGWIQLPGSDEEVSPILDIKLEVTADEDAGGSGKPEGEAKKPEKKTTELVGEVLNPQANLTARFKVDRRVLVSMQAEATTPAPPPLSPEQIVRKVAPPTWVRKIEVDFPEMKNAEDGAFSANGPAKVFIEDKGQRSRIIADAAVSGWVFENPASVEAVIDVRRGEFPPLTENGFKMRRGKDGSIEFILRMEVKALPVPPSPPEQTGGR